MTLLAAARPSVHVPARHYLLPALLWSLAHGLLVLAFYHHGLARAAESLAPGLRVATLAGHGIQALGLGLLGFVLTLPCLLLDRRYAVVAPFAIAVLAAGLFIDSLFFDVLGIHVNGLVLQVAMQPNGLAETGLPTGEVIKLVCVLVGGLVADGLAGSFVLRRFATPRQPWAIALAIVGLWAGERLSSAYLIFAGGPPAEAAVRFLPLQPRVRLNSFLGRITGREPIREPNATLTPQVGTPASAIDPAEVELDRTPDVLLVLIESLRADFLTPEVMPHLYRRSRQGTIFLRHYAASASTQFSLFGLLYGLDVQRRDAVIGAGRTPLLFSALKRHGYRSRFLTASSVEWMDLRQTVFRDVADGLETEYQGSGSERDVAMLASAGRVLADLPLDEPLFLFLFFAGTHYNYSYPETSAVFRPAWDGTGTLATFRRDPELVKNRAKNAAFEVDRKLEGFLAQYEARRGQRPLLIVTGDHGEEFGEAGRFAHATDVNVRQLHVPMVLFDERVPAGAVDRVTSHVDVVPTILGLLGDSHDPSLIGDGFRMDQAPADRYVLASVGWEQKFALIGPDLKVVFRGRDAGFGGIAVTDPDDRPLPDAEARFARAAPTLLRRLRPEPLPTMADSR